MEVHAHTHTSRKKWTHYFWEFLMLFLAVFCGFLAEYQLEHQIEKDREKQYMISLLEDLHIDTTTLQDEYQLGERQKMIVDTLLEIINDHPITPDNIKKIYLLSSNSTRVVNAVFENRTSSQLKNSGGMRLIRKKKVSDSLMSYWQNAEICNSISERLDFIAAERSDLHARLFHNKYLIRDGGIMTPVSDIKEGASLISNDPALLAEYSNRTYSRKGILNNYLSNMKRTKERAVRLMEIIRSEYDIE
jgi:hypothetical protein